MITALTREPALVSKLTSDRDSIFRDYALTEEEIEALNDGSIRALSRISVNPMLCMHWLLVTNPAAAEQMSVSEYLPIVKG